MTQHINSPVSITALQFGRNMQPIPRRMEWAGQTYRFVDGGIRVATRRGEQAASTVTLSDGIRNFCLRQSGATWMLLSVC